MSFGSVKNAAGKFVKASTDGVYCGSCSRGEDDACGLSCLDHQCAGSNRLSDFELYLVADSSRIHRSSEGKALEGFPDWMLDHGESEAAGLGYAPLPKPVQDMVRKTFSQVQ